MSKKIFGSVAAIAALLTLVLVMTAFAAPGMPAKAKATSDTATEAQAAPVAQLTPMAAAPATLRNTPFDAGFGGCPMMAAPSVDTAGTDFAGCDLSTLMLDENGELVSEEVLNANLDKAIADGYLNAEDKDFFLEMFGAMSDGGGCFGFGGCPMMR